MYGDDDAQIDACFELACLFVDLVSECPELSGLLQRQKALISAYAMDQSLKKNTIREFVDIALTVVMNRTIFPDKRKSVIEIIDSVEKTLKILK